MLSKKIIFYSEANNIIGSGHLARMIGACEYFSTIQPNNFKIELTSSDEVIPLKFFKEWYKKKPNFDFNKLDISLDGDWGDFSDLCLSKLLLIEKVCNIEILIIDGKFFWKNDDWLKLCKRFDVVISIDNLISISEYVYSNIFPTSYFNSSNMGNYNIHTGEDWQWINPLVKLVKQPTNKDFDYSIFMGGSDPNNLTLVAINDILSLGGENSHILVLVGPYYKHIHSLDIFKNHLNIQIEYSDTNFLERMLDAKTSLCAFGLSSIELSYLLQPTVLYTHNQLHLSEAIAYQNKHPFESILRSDWIKGKSPFLNLSTKVLPKFCENLYKLVLSSVKKYEQ